MKIMTDREFRERIREAQDELARQHGIADDYMRLLDRISKLESEVYHLKCQLKEGDR